MDNKMTSENTCILHREGTESEATKCKTIKASKYTFLYLLALMRAISFNDQIKNVGKYIILYFYNICNMYIYLQNMVHILKTNKYLKLKYYTFQTI